MAKVKILYTGPVADIVRSGMEIARMFHPCCSYIDSAPYTEGITNNTGYSVDGVECGKTVLPGEQIYGKSVYATNVDGWGNLPGLLPMATNPGRFAQFERAILAAKEAAEAGKMDTGIVFDIGDDYKEALYWEQMGFGMKDYFDVTVSTDGAVLEYNIPAVFTVGEPTEFSISTVAGAKAGEKVVGTSEGDLSKVEKFEYLEGADWKELTGDTFGPADGFPLMDATSKFRVTFKEPGVTTVKFIIKAVADDAVVMEQTLDFVSK